MTHPFSAVWRPLTENDLVFIARENACKSCVVR